MTMMTSLNGQFPATISESVREAVETIFASFCEEPPTYQGDGGEANLRGDLVGSISFMGDAPWLMTLVFPAATATAAAQKFAGFEIPFDSSDMGDVVGELANVLAGEISAQLKSKNIKTQISLPIVARGQDVEVLLPDETATARLCFRSTQGDFWLKLATTATEKHHFRKPGT